MKLNEDSIIIDKFAPIAIPTLCRYSHFKQCIESLMTCTHAEKTDVFIGLDYPSEDKHWHGYKLICEYLNSIKDNHNFKSLNIIKREKNYGFGINGNARTLVNYILRKYDTIIFSEDDNVFSPSFLDYCNKGLIIYKNNEDILAICGYRNYYDFKFASNTVARQGMDFVAWGYATWKDRRESYKNITPQWFRKQFTITKFLKFRKSNGNYRALGWLQFCLRPMKAFTLPDDGLSIYMGLANKYTIMPYISLVKNIGVDGTGQHFNKRLPKLERQFINQKVSEDKVFYFKGNDEEFYKENMAINAEQAYNRISNTRFPFEILNMFFGKLRTYIKRLMR